MKINNYDDALRFIHGRQRFKKKPTLKRMRHFLELLGNPQSGLQYVHITGTNGKGSTVAMLRQLLEKSGLTVGSFTSPFITRFNERICYDGQPISDTNLIKYTQQVAKVAEQLDNTEIDGGPTEFEIDTAIMFCYFADVQPDIVILEVGIGGLYDSTNVIEKNIVSAIVTVGYDHMKYLGDTLAAIAKQKAGIIKPGCPVVIGNVPDEARDAILNTARNKHAQTFVWNKQYHAATVVKQKVKPLIDYEGLDIPKTKFQLSLAGEYQIENAAVAITLFQIVMKKFGLAIIIKDIREALEDVSWPGRMEVVNDEPLVILDGAHNLPGMHALANSIDDEFSDRNVYVLVAILADKQYELMIGELASLKNVHITLTNFNGPYPGRKSADLYDVQDINTRYPMRYSNSWQEGLVHISSEMSADDVLIITGSLYFIADVRHFMLDN